MANHHATEFSKIRGCRILAACDIIPGRAEDFARRHGIPHFYSSEEEVLASEHIDAVSIVTPDGTHAELSLRAISAGLHVLCEKPLAVRGADASRMARAAARKGVINMVNFSYRNAPAIQRARDLVASGRLGRPVHIEASYLQSWLSSKVWGDWRTESHWLWRLSRKHGSNGVLGDIGVHILDFASYPVGDIRTVSARLKTFPEFKGRRIGDYPLDANDSATITAEFAGGALGIINATRWATGHANTVRLQVHCEHGAVRMDLDRSLTQLEICAGRDVDRAAWKTMECRHTPSIYERFIHSIRTGKNDQPDFARGAAVQKVIDACFKSDALGRMVKV